MADEPLSGVDKAAVLLLALGPEVASEVFRHLDEVEVRQVTKALARIRKVPGEHLKLVEHEYRKRIGAAGGLHVDGLLFARALVNQSLGGAEAAAGTSRDDILAELESLPTGEMTGLARALDGVPPDGKDSSSARMSSRLAAPAAASAFPSDWFTRARANSKPSTCRPPAAPIRLR